MSALTVEFIGGPKDGERVEVWQRNPADLPEMTTWVIRRIRTRGQSDQFEMAEYRRHVPGLDVGPVPPWRFEPVAPRVG